MKNEIKYVHETDVHNLKAPEEIVPLLIKIFNPVSVLDVGCGIGNWLSVFKKNGVEKIMGIDGDYVNKNLLSGYIGLNEFISVDLSMPFDLQKRFGLVVCLEVAEHLAASVAETFVESLCYHSDIIVFSAAIPNQGGQNHLNEQWPEYWINIFKKKSYQCYDILRPLLWDNAQVEWWYKQNLLIFSKVELDGYNPASGFYSIVHPLHFQQKINYIKDLDKKIYNLSNKISVHDNKKGINKYWNIFLKFFGKNTISNK